MERGAGIQQDDGAAEEEGLASLAQRLHVQRPGDCGRNLCGDEFDLIPRRLGEYTLRGRGRVTSARANRIWAIVTADGRASRPNLDERSDRQMFAETAFD